MKSTTQNCARCSGCLHTTCHNQIDTDSRLSSLAALGLHVLSSPEPVQVVGDSIWAVEHTSRQTANPTPDQVDGDLAGAASTSRKVVR